MSLPEEYLQILSSAKATKKSPIIILVAGGSGSGKTTFAGMLSVMLKLFHIVAAIVSIDDFYKALMQKHKNPKEVNFDLPDAIDFDKLFDVLQQMLRGEATSYPQYDFETHSSSNTFIKHGLGIDVIIVEGLHALYDSRILQISKFQIFIKASEQHRHNRRIERATTLWHRPLEEAESQYKDQVVPAFQKFIEDKESLENVIVLQNDLEVYKMFDNRAFLELFCKIRSFV